MTITRRRMLALVGAGLPAFRSTWGRAADLGADPRLGPAKTLDGYFPFAVPETLAAWDARRNRLRRQVRVAVGLWPMPEKAPLEPAVHGKIERDGYTVEKVSFASMPGHTISGNLYRPTGRTGRRPGVLFAHGHWADGRFHEADAKSVAADVAAKAEPDAATARHFIQAGPAALARLGFAVFAYDMVGYADSTAIPHAVRPGGFGDVGAELRLQSLMGLQTWNSIRALDFLTALPDVDPARIGMTGASGGGTQTFLLGAIDDRLAAIFPAVMVSAGMQGGCVCENCSYLRVGTGNVELAALFAPKPMAFSCADDWTRDFLKDGHGFPELKELYALYGKPDGVAAKAWPEYGHNYNRPAREFMYTWFAEHLLGEDGPAAEPRFEPIPPRELSAFDAAHPRPAGELDPAGLRKALSEASDAQLRKLAPTDAASLARFREVVGSAWKVMLGADAADEFVPRKPPIESKGDGRTILRAVAGRKGGDDAVPLAAVSGAKFDGGKAVVWVHPEGKANILGGDPAGLRTLLDGGCAVVAPDVHGVGELTPAKPRTVDPRYAGYTFGYNRPLLAERVRDVLAAVGFARSNWPRAAVHLIGWKEAGPWAVLARAALGDAAARTAADLNGFDFDRVADADDPMMLPGAVKYGGLAAALALCAPGHVLAFNAPASCRGEGLPTAAYRAAGAAGKLRVASDPLSPADAVEWLMG